MAVSQMLKGTLEGCILKIISTEETYGYEIVETLRKYGFTDISEGTLYPLLLRLERNQQITAQYRESSVGPRRKYYSILPSGESAMHHFYQNWLLHSKSVYAIFNEGDSQNEPKMETIKSEKFES